MSVYHTERCQIMSTNVYSDGVDRDVVLWNEPVTLYFVAKIDNALRREASGFHLMFHLFSLGRAFIGGHDWTGHMSELPGTTGIIWACWTWQDGADALRYSHEPILYRPSVWFTVSGADGANDEFAVAEEDHYIFGVDRHGFR